MRPESVDLFSSNEQLGCPEIDEKKCQNLKSPSKVTSIRWCQTSENKNKFGKSDKLSNKFQVSYDVPTVKRKQNITYYWLFRLKIIKNDKNDGIVYWKWEIIGYFERKLFLSF